MRRKSLRGLRKIVRGCSCPACRSSPQTKTARNQQFNSYDGGRRIVSLELRAYGDAYGGRRKTYAADTRIV